MNLNNFSSNYIDILNKGSNGINFRYNEDGNDEHQNKNNEQNKSLFLL